MRASERVMAKMAESKTEAAPAAVKPVLKLRLEAGRWCADFAETPEAQKMIDLFGSVCIPTPFRAGADPEAVRRSIGRLNPAYDVVDADAWIAEGGKR